jgi:hypothetical protein
LEPFFSLSDNRRRRRHAVLRAFAGGRGSWRPRTGGARRLRCATEEGLADVGASAHGSGSEKDGAVVAHEREERREVGGRGDSVQSCWVVDGLLLGSSML